MNKLAKAAGKATRADADRAQIWSRDAGRWEVLDFESIARRFGLAPAAVLAEAEEIWARDQRAKAEVGQ